MKNKNAIKKAISLAVLTALVQNQKMDALGRINLKYIKELNPVRALNPMKLVKKGADLVMKAQATWRGSDISRGADETEITLAHTANSCWVNTFASVINSFLSDAEIDEILEKLENYEHGYMEETITEINDFVVVNADTKKLKKLKETNEESIKLLKLLLNDLKQIRAQKKIKLSRQTKEACGYIWYNGGKAPELVKKIMPALELCGYTPEFTGCFYRNELSSWKKTGNSFAVLINGKEPGGHPHIYFILAKKNGTEWKYKELNDMTEYSYKGYVKDLAPEEAENKMVNSNAGAFMLNGSPETKNQQSDENTLDLTALMTFEFE